MLLRGFGGCGFVVGVRLSVDTRGACMPSSCLVPVFSLALSFATTFPAIAPGDVDLGCGETFDIFMIIALECSLWILQLKSVGVSSKT